MRSLVARLNIGLLASLSVLFIALWLLFRWSVGYLVETYVAARLEHDAESLLAALTFDTRGALQLPDERVDALFRRPFSGHYYRIALLEDRAEVAVLRSRSLWDEDVTLSAAKPGEHLQRTLRGPQGQRLLVRQATYSKHGRTVSILVAEDLSPVYKDLQRLQHGLALAVLLAILVLMGLQTNIVRLGLRPLRQAADQVRRLERGDIARLAEDVPSEVLPLVRETNRLLELLSRRLERSRNAIGDLAHALKAPLTVIGRLADEPSMQRETALHTVLAKQIEAIRRRVDRELKRARLAGGAVAGQSVDLSSEVPSLLEVLRSIHRDRALDLECRIPDGTRFPGDREDMLELLGNLLDNACKWAERRVRLTVRTTPGLDLLVEDDGPGCPLDQLALITQRGVRLDESRPGQGLGLGIVRDVVDSYDGEVAFGQSPELGGLSVTVRLGGRAGSEHPSEDST